MGWRASYHMGILLSLFSHPFLNSLAWVFPMETDLNSTRGFP
jgi:hypothetical protein